MIKVNNIKGKPESIPDNYVGINSDDKFFYFFETEKEKESFYAELPVNPEWNKQSIEDRAERLFDKALEENWYSRFDVQFYANKGEAKAISLMQYYNNLWKLIEQNFENGNYDFKLPEYIDNTINKP
jgi:hypothetical protein